LAKDPVCGMDVDEKKAMFKLEYKGVIYYFCCRACKEDFDKNPKRYVR
jgi:YHS domain-containing protein